MVLAPEIMPLVQPIFCDWEVHVCDGAGDMDELVFEVEKIAGGVW
jgi:hypothetical protein